MTDFSVFERNPGHWDVTAKPKTAQPGRDWPVEERAFTIRGEPGNVRVADHRTDQSRPFPRASLEFRSVQLATAWICDELMFGPIIAKEGAEMVDNDGNNLIACRPDQVRLP